MEYPRIRGALSFLRRTPFHPQWFACRREREQFSKIGGKLRGVILDAGCGDKRIAPFLARARPYVGLDYYPTAKEWYKSRPHIYGDAQRLPFRAGSFDSMLLLNVLEHLPDPEACMAEAMRVIKPGGMLILKVPFLYPLHDEPLDFHRWTVHGLRRIVEDTGFVIEEEVSHGMPLETGALLLNIAAAKVMLRSVERRSLVALFSLVLPLLILAANVFAWAFTLLVPADRMMPYAYELWCVKKG